MIQPFWGEGFISPIPLHLSLTYCSHACAYCFANLNSPNRTFDVKKTMRFLSDYQNRVSYEAQLMRWHTPICISNLVDPFAASNGQSFLRIARILADLGIPMQFQTRGSTKPAWIDEILAMLSSPTVWYISVSTMNDDLRKTLEPGAPPIASRFALMERLRHAGHHVVLGYNPCVRDWQDDPEPVLAQAESCGVSGVWIESLHLNYTQIRNMSKREQAAIGDSLLQRAQKRRRLPEDTDHILYTRHVAQDYGLEIFSLNQGYRSDFFSPYSTCYPTAFPVLQSFVNYCYDTSAENRLISFDEYADFFCSSLPAGVYPLDSYLGASAHDIWRRYQIPTTMTFRQLLAIAWHEKGVKFAPVRLPCFAWAGQWDDGTMDGEKGWYQLVDAYGMPYLVFQPVSLVHDGFSDYYTDQIPG